ncbi:MAG: biotin-dependent carboxyltransferase family protein [Proteobacteria bacterium]|nr:biotin-dependent carboxyltransferase family protein [Pseudomonadota bacterium]
MSLAILAPGMLTTVQDAGRHDVRALGVGVGGAVDAYSYTVANRLVGNPATAAALEITWTGPTLRLRRAARIALCGADIDARANGIALPGWRSIDLPADCTLTLGPCRRGARAYLAIDGGIDVPPVLGSRSTDLRGGFGGYEGRPLRAGDTLALAPTRLPKPVRRIAIAPWWIDHEPDLFFTDSIAVRVLSGHAATAPIDALLSAEFAVSAASNRQGLRLHGPPLRLADPRQHLSEPVVPGTIQLPPDGQPIVLLADAQTVGGYARIGHAIAADLPRLAQRRTGQRVRFILVDAAHAARADAAQRARLGKAALAIGAAHLAAERGLPSFPQASGPHHRQ